jgi:hypothetical protein
MSTTLKHAHSKATLCEEHQYVDGKLIINWTQFL